MFKSYTKVIQKLYIKNAVALDGRGFEQKSYMYNNFFTNTKINTLLLFYLFIMLYITLYNKYSLQPTATLDFYV